MHASPFDLASPPTARRPAAWVRLGAGWRVGASLALAAAAGVVELVALWRARRRGTPRWGRPARGTPR